MGELYRVRCDGGGIITQVEYGANPWHLHPPDEVGQRGRGRADHILGVLPQVVSGSEVSSDGVPGGSS